MPVCDLLQILNTRPVSTELDVKITLLKAILKPYLKFPTPAITKLWNREIIWRKRHSSRVFNILKLMWEGPRKNMQRLPWHCFSFSFGFVSINRTIGVHVWNKAKRQATNLTHCCSYLSNYKFRDGANFEVILGHGFSNCGKFWYNHWLLVCG
jgi:hypothetical protein